MKASVRWLRELCPQLPDDPNAIAARLTSAGLEVEDVQAFGLGTEACVVASVVSTRAHPSRSGLRLVTVDRGGARQEVVCGAPNVPEPGGLVVLAPLGTHLPAKGMTIERRAIAGVTSEGMLCSEAELGLSDDAGGILVLPPGVASPGALLAQAIPSARDTILELGLTPNRPDALGHLGLAREAAALFEVSFASSPSPDAPARTRSEDVSQFVTVAIADAERCAHYGAGVVLDVTIGPSPLEVRWRLGALGVRSISNVVDVTNLVMLELGHPMHAFDLDRVGGASIVVRLANEGEKLATLDGIERILGADDLVVCDGDGPVALAGVMGGSRSEIGPSTKRVLLECAYFDPRAVRRAARRHGLHTESSHRFERGVDWGDTRHVLDRAASLVATLAGGTPLKEARIFEARALARRTVALRYERAEALLGTPVDRASAQAILGRLGFSRRASQADLDVWEAPSFRADVAREVDLIEEVARVRGLDAIPTTLPAVRPSRDAGPREGLARRARRAAVGMGLSEAITFSFVDARDLDALAAPPPVVRLRNPLGEERSVMRTSLLPGLLHAVGHARRHGERDARLFTVGSTFLSRDAARDGRADAASAGPLDERLAFAAVLAGDRPSWLSKAEPMDVWDAKGVAEGLVARILARSADVRAAKAEERPRHLHPRGASFVEVEGTRVGSLGPLHPDLLETFDLEESALVVEVDLTLLDSLGARVARFAPLPRFPSSTRDLAVVVSEDVAAGAVEGAVRDVAAGLAEQVRIFDRFFGGAVPAGHVSLALRVIYRAADRTLTDAEVDARHGQVVAEVQKRFGAQLRS
jgi:phenylalanyl-tRNA synthetase beta chain